MQQNTGSLSLSKLIHNPDYVVEDCKEMPLPTSKDTEYIKEYGIGIDCHSKFISISIRYRCGNNIEIAQKDFGTAWNDLIEGRDWCIKVLMEKADPIPDMSEPLHYVLESTANYHMPVCMAWGGNPTIINPP